MFEVHITMTGKGYRSTYEDNYSCFGEDTKRFKDMESVKAWIAETYGKCKRIPMYRDHLDGAVRCGTIFCFNNADMSHSPVDRWRQQDWVTVSECKNLDVSL